MSRTLNQELFIKLPLKTEWCIICCTKNCIRILIKDLYTILTLAVKKKVLIKRWIGSNILPAKFPETILALVGF